MSRPQSWVISTGLGKRAVPDDFLDSYTEKITMTGTITSPNHPNKYPAGTQCVKWIVAPECHTPRLTFNSFRLLGKTRSCNRRSCCYSDSLEIRTSDMLTGDV
ncbi:hypothetical protein Pcinc_002826 [Petrolisthes cinctipes]|uniref:CUB domain-containing protein n=1 Tax=Petrolisthes cinctipes TaxID=88211 RepID=A0AAE1L1X7_PETCI|nr:hypothetical protein Pcinc_002826 [Petrolisthes cinctipes]